jgi:hypothetical protein
MANYSERARENAQLNGLRTIQATVVMNPPSRLWMLQRRQATNSDPASSIIKQPG